MGSIPFTTEDFAVDLLSCLNINDRDDTVDFIIAWAHGEGGAGFNSKWNPLNTSKTWEGATIYNSDGVKNYQSYKDGVAATVATLKIDKYGYPKILDALLNGSFTDMRQAVIDSSWGTTAEVLLTSSKQVTEAMTDRVLNP